MSQITLDDAVRIANGAIAVGRYDVAVAMCEKSYPRIPGKMR